MAHHVDELRAVRQRLKEGKLSDKDIQVLDGLVANAEEAAHAVSSAKEKIGDRVVIAHLPFGMDVVK